MVVSYAMYKTKKDSNKYIKLVVKLLGITVLIILFPFRVIVAISPILMAILAYLGYSFIIPIIIGFAFQFFGVKEEIIRFMYLSLTPIIAVAFHKSISHILIKNIQASLKGFGKRNKKISVEVIKYLLNVDNIRFLIYLSYFIFLIVFSFKSIDSYLQEELTDFVILQAFLVFLAFDNIRINSKGIVFSPPKLLNQVKQMIIGSNEDVSLEDDL